MSNTFLRIAIWLPSGRLYLELIVACAAGGYVAVNVNTRYSAGEAYDLTERSGASVLVTDQSVKTDSSVTVLGFRTGDLGVTSTDGSFRFITRMGDTLRVGGFLVAPAEIEEVLLTFAGIEDAQVVAASGENGVRPVAFVIASNELDEQSVIGHCRQHLAKFKCPVRVLTVPEFPVTDGPNGVKIQKSRLREMAHVALEDSGER